MKKRLSSHFPLFLVFFFLGVFSFDTNNLLAQASESPVRISVRIIETGFQKINDKGKNNYVWKFYKGSMCNEDSVLTNSKSETCFRLKTKKNSKTKEISDEKDDLRPFLADISGFKITMEAFLNKKGGEKCFSDPKDAFYGIKTEDIKTDNLAPGAWSEEIRIADAFGRFFAVIDYKYELIDGLSKIEFVGNSLINDASKNTELSLPIKLPKKGTLPFTWSYSIEHQDNWHTIPNSAEDKSKIAFNPLKNIFGSEPPRGSKKVDFKAEVEIGGKTETSKTLTLTFAPPPPSFNKEKDIQLTPVCNALATGSIEIKNIKATAADIKYVLRKKSAAPEPCNFKNPSAETCPDYVNAGTITGKNSFSIRNLPAGDYVIYVFNADMESGEVNTSASFTISELSPLKNIDLEPSTKDPTCSNLTGGEIHMKVEGGATLWQIVIIPNVIPDKAQMIWDGNFISFKNLEAGKYTVYLTDRCGGEGHEITKTFTLKKPKQISIYTKSILPFQEKTEFFIMLNILNGTNDYKAIVTDQDNNVSESFFYLLPDMKLPIGKVGTYTIDVTDNGKPACPPARVRVKVEKSSSKAAKFKLTVLDE